MADVDPDRRALEAVIGPVRSPRADFRDPLETTLLFRAQAWRALDGRVNTNGGVLATSLVVGRSWEEHALAAHLGTTHWIVVFERLLAMIDDVFTTLAAISNDQGFFAPAHGFDASRLHHPPGFRWHSEAHRTAPTPGLEAAADINALLAGFMAHVALRFVVDHEYFHVAHGHILLAETLFDRPTLPELARLASPREHDMRLAMEMEADRSALTQIVLDTLAGELPSNDAVDGLTDADRLTLAVVAVAVVVGLWEAEQEAFGTAEGDSHPVTESRLSMLLQPTLARALRGAGLEGAAINAIGTAVGSALAALGQLHRVFLPPLDALDPDRREMHDIDNRRLEMTYLVDVAPLLRAHQFSSVQAPPP